LVTSNLTSCSALHFVHILMLHKMSLY
jgi:hypothetical protein